MLTTSIPLKVCGAPESPPPTPHPFMGGSAVGESPPRPGERL